MTNQNHALLRWLSACALACLLATPQSSVAQGPVRPTLVSTAAADTLPCWACVPRPKKFWPAAGEMSVGLFVPWSYNAFIRKASFAWTNPHTWYDNIFGAWVWDDNAFLVNQIGHPYQGSTYFSGFRNNGYGFWSSSAAAWVGSFLWECCYETHPASPNDLITTAVGGMSIGEFGRRLSDMIIDNRARGAERFAREVTAGIVNPIRLFDRLVRAEAWKIGANDPAARPAWFQGAMDLGYIGLSTTQETRDSTYGGGLLRLGLIYGDPMETVTGKPFSHFELSTALTSIPSAYLYSVRSRGSLGGRALRRDSTRTTLLASFLNYDYNKNPAYEFGAQSVTGGLLNRWRPNAKTSVYSDALVRGILLGAIETDFYNVTGEGRNYDFTAGLGVALELAVVRRGLGSIRGTYNYSALRTLDGAASSHLLQGGEVTARYNLGPQYAIGGMYRTSWRRSFYGDGRRTVANAPEFRLFLSTGLPRAEH